MTDKKENTGYGNTGNLNTGYLNTGDGNTGYRNTGNLNTGNHNTGDHNRGDHNTGYRNTGDHNTGNQNTGYRNTGYGNTGDRNTGYGNTGYGNTGNRNTGDHNTGDRNTGDHNTGYLNTTTPTQGLLFNRLCELWDSDGNCVVDFPRYFYFDVDTTERIDWDDMTSTEKHEHQYAESMGGYLKKYDTDNTLHTYRKRSFDKASKEDVAKTLELPNFDYKIFEEISGITKEDFDKKLGETNDDAMEEAMELLKSKGYKIIKE